MFKQKLSDLTNEKINKLSQLHLESIKNINCLSSIKDYFTKFQNIYLRKLNIFLLNIPKTLKKYMNLIIKIITISTF